MLSHIRSIKEDEMGEVVELAIFTGQVLGIMVGIFVIFWLVIRHFVK